MCTGAIHNFSQLVALRFLLGMCEAAISPGFSLITGMWYKRKEQPFRHGVWFAGNGTASLFGGLLSYAIAHITSTSLAPWRWLYIIFGLASLLWSIVLFLLLPNNPLTAKFLSEGDRLIAIERSRENNTGIKNNHWKFHQVGEALIDPKTWLLVSIMMATSIPNGGISNFLSLTTAGFGFNTLQTLLLSIPSFAGGVLAVVVSTYFASRFPNSRCFIMAIALLISIVGAALVYGLPQTNKAGRMVGLCIWPAFVATFPLILSMVASNYSGFTKKATATASIFVFYAVGNIVGPFLYFSYQAPTYSSGFLSAIICQAIAVALCFVLRFYLMWQNQRRDRLIGTPIDTTNCEARLEIENGLVISDETDWQKKDFRYVM